MLLHASLWHDVESVPCEASGEVNERGPYRAITSPASLDSSYLAMLVSFRMRLAGAAAMRECRGR